LLRQGKARSSAVASCRCTLSEVAFLSGSTSLRRFLCGTCTHLSEMSLDIPQRTWRQVRGLDSG